MLKVLFVASEVYPFVKTGGLGDVAYALPKALKKAGVDIRVILPLYQSIGKEHKDAMEFLGEVAVPVGWRTQQAALKRLEYDGVTFYFIENDYYFLREGTYGFYDDGERFAFFDRAVLAALETLSDFVPDLIHLNDWQTGMVPILLKHFYKDSAFAKAKTLFSIHNLKFQGIFQKQVLTELLGLDESYFTEDSLKFYEGISFMKGAIIYSDFINTVSPTYAQEIKTGFYGEGLDGLLREYSGKLSGIINGIDYEVFNPSKDKKIVKTYHSVTLSDKTINKTALQRQLGLSEDSKIPMIGMVGRLTKQKGFDLVIEMMEEILSLNVQLVVLGTGEERYEEVFGYYASRYPTKVSANILFSDELSRKIYAASDMFLMPSLFEPCGLSQLMALKYGSVPIVRETGGLKDTIIAYNEYTGKGNGFSFANFNAHDMLHILKYALTIYENKEKWKRLVRSAMRCDYSWKKEAGNYVDLYIKLTNLR